MKVFIISSTNINFARNLFSGTKIQTSYSFGNSILSPKIKRRMSFSDAIVAIIDQDTSGSPYLMAEITHAISVVSNPRILKNPVFIPILINNATLPDELANSLYISCNPQFSSQMKHIKSEVLHLLQYRPTPLLFSPEYKLKPLGRFVLALMGLIIGSLGLISLGDAWSTFINGLSAANSFSELLSIAPEMLVSLVSASIALFFLSSITDQLMYSIITTLSRILSV